MSDSDSEETEEKNIQKVDELHQATSANKLLDRTPEDAYINEWTDLVKKEKTKESITEESSVVIFRFNQEWLALSTQVFTEVTRNRVIHTLPHRSNPTLLGCVNFRGQLWLCASLNTVLEIEGSESGASKDEGSYERMLAIHKGQERWILPVDEVFGVHHIDQSNLENVPVTVKKSTANYILGIFNWRDKHVAVLDDELLFYSLRRSLS